MLLLLLKEVLKKVRVLRYLHNNSKMLIQKSSKRNLPYIIIAKFSEVILCVNHVRFLCPFML